MKSSIFKYFIRLSVHHDLIILNKYKEKPKISRDRFPYDTLVLQLELYREMKDENLNEQRMKLKRQNKINAKIIYSMELIIFIVV